MLLDLDSGVITNLTHSPQNEFTGAWMLRPQRLPPPARSIIERVFLCCRRYMFQILLKILARLAGLMLMIFAIFWPYAHKNRMIGWHLYATGS